MQTTTPPSENTPGINLFVCPCQPSHSLPNTFFKIFSSSLTLIHTPQNAPAISTYPPTPNQNPTPSLPTAHAGNQHASPASRGWARRECAPHTSTLHV